MTAVLTAGQTYSLSAVDLAKMAACQSPLAADHDTSLHVCCIYTARLGARLQNCQQQMTLSHDTGQTASLHMNWPPAQNLCQAAALCISTCHTLGWTQAQGACQEASAAI